MSATGVLTFDIKEFILNLFGYKTTYCVVAWYVRFYFELIVLFPLVEILEKLIYKRTNSPLITTAILLVANLVLRTAIGRFDFSCVSYVIEFLNYLPVVMVGYYVAWDSAFEKFAKKTAKLNLNRIIICVAYVVEFLCIFVIRGLLTGSSWYNIDVILAPVFVFCTWYLTIALDKNKMANVVKKVLSFLGRYSLEVWFLHAIFFIGNATVQKIAYWPKIDILILVWTIVLLLPFAIWIHKLVDKIVQLFTKSKQYATR